jgi:replicative DNA helicase
MELSDVGAERAVLSGICQYGLEAYIDVADLINCNTFTTQYNKILYKCLEQIIKDKQTVDETTIVVTADRMGLYDHLLKEKKDIEFIRSIFNFPIKLDNVRKFAGRIAKIEFARVAQEKIKQAHDDLGRVDGSESIDNILAIPENAIFDLIYEANRGTDNNPELITNGAQELLQSKLDNPSDIAGLPTPWQCYNTLIGGGLRRGGVNLIGARPKVGKTTLCKEACLHFAIDYEIPVLMLDTEMVKEDQLFRSLASLSGVDVNTLQTGQFRDKKEEVFEALEKLSQAKYCYKSIAGKPFEEVLSIIRRWILTDVGMDENGNTNDCVVMYDYFKLMNEDALKVMQEYQALGFQISHLSDFCKEYDFACMAFVQLNRQEDVSQSDRLRWLCHSYARFRKKTPEEEAEDGVNEGNRKMHIEDTRFGPGLDDDYINLKLDGYVSKVTEIGLNRDKDKRIQMMQKGEFTDDEDKVPTPDKEGMTHAF